MKIGSIVHLSALGQDWLSWSQYQKLETAPRRSYARVAEVDPHGMHRIVFPAQRMELWVTAREIEPA